MLHAIAGASESRRAAADTTSWRPALVGYATGFEIVLEVESERSYYRFVPQLRQCIPEDGTTVAVSDRLHLVAAPCAAGPVIPLDETLGVFALLGPAPGYVFLAVEPGEEPGPDEACSRCRFPDGVPPGEMCLPHRRLEPMGLMPGGGRLNRLEVAADAAAFAGPARRLAEALVALEAWAYPLQARRFVEKYAATLDRFPSPAERGLVAVALRRLARRTRRADLAARFDAQIREAAEAVGPMMYVDGGITAPWSALPARRVRG